MIQKIKNIIGMLEMGVKTEEQAINELWDLLNKYPFNKKDMENSFIAGADKKNWTKIKLTGVVYGNDFTLEPIFDKWFNEYYFTCDCCGKVKTGKKHKMYDENWNLQRGCYECNDCYESRLNAQISKK